MYTFFETSCIPIMLSVLLRGNNNKSTPKKSLRLAYIIDKVLIFLYLQ